MRRTLALLVAVVALTGAMAAPVSAVTYGTPDTTHDYVGLLVFYDENGTPLWRCTGTLISPKVVLTAGHCTYGTDSARFYLGETILASSGYPTSGGITGTPSTYPEYNPDAFNVADVGVVVLDGRGVRLSTYGQLPAIGTVDAIEAAGGQQLLTIVGYGLQGVKPLYSADRTRYQGTVMFIESTSALAGNSFRYSADPGTAHSGGGCFGDSGGPVFIEGTNIILGVTSYVLNSNCKGTGGAFAIDTQPVQDWINSFL